MGEYGDSSKRTIKEALDRPIGQMIAPHQFDTFKTMTFSPPISTYYPIERGKPQKRTPDRGKCKKKHIYLCVKPCNDLLPSQTLIVCLYVSALPCLALLFAGTGILVFDRL